MLTKRMWLIYIASSIMKNHCATICCYSFNCNMYPVLYYITVILSENTHTHTTKPIQIGLCIEITFIILWTCLTEYLRQELINHRYCQSKLLRWMFNGEDWLHSLSFNCCLYTTRSNVRNLLAHSWCNRFWCGLVINIPCLLLWRAIWDLFHVLWDFQRLILLCTSPYHYNSFLPLFVNVNIHY